MSFLNLLISFEDEHDIERLLYGEPDPWLRLFECRHDLFDGVDPVTGEPGPPIPHTHDPDPPDPDPSDPDPPDPDPPGSDPYDPGRPGQDPNNPQGHPAWWQHASPQERDEAREYLAATYGIDVDLDVDEPARNYEDAYRSTTPRYTAVGPDLDEHFEHARRHRQEFFGDEAAREELPARPLSDHPLDAGFVRFSSQAGSQETGPALTPAEPVLNRSQGEIYICGGERVGLGVAD